jgi:hypothetical protein
MAHHDGTTQSDLRDLSLVDLLVDCSGREESVDVASLLLTFSMNAAEDG